jgi:fibrillarin-like rRNA methylase
VPIFRPSLKYSTEYAMLWAARIGRLLVAAQPSRSGFCPVVNDDALAVPYTKFLKNVVDVNFNSAKP